MLGPALGTQQPHELGEERLESCSAEQDLGVLVNRWLNTSQRVPSGTLACISNGVASRAGTVPLYWGGHTSGPVLCSVAADLVKGLGSNSDEKQLRELGLLSQE